MTTQSPGGAPGSTAPFRVVLGDDTDLIRDALAISLPYQGIEIAGQARSFGELGVVVAATRPDVAVVDLRMPPHEKIDEALRSAVALRRDHPGTGVLVLSNYLEARYLFELLDSGLHGIGYLHKERAGKVGDFAAALRRVHAGEQVVDPDIAKTLISRNRPVELLTERQREVLTLVAEGRSNEAISRALTISERTVERHNRDIFDRLGLPDESDHHRRVLAVLYFLRDTER